MTTFQIHLLMLALGLAAGLFVAGIFPKKTKGSAESKPWFLGILSILVVAAAPLSRFWLPAEAIDLLTQSLSVAAIGLVSLLVLALVYRGGWKATPVAAPLAAPVASESLPAIAIDADTRSDSAQANVPQQILDEAGAREFDPSILQNGESGLFQNDAPAAANASDVNIGEAKNDTTFTTEQNLPGSTSDSEATGNTSSGNDNAAAEDDITMDMQINVVDEEEFDLTDTENLFAELREQNQLEIDLPDSNDWLDADTVSFAQSRTTGEPELVIASQTTTGTDTESADKQLEVEEAEVVTASKDSDDSLAFGNNVTGEYAHPDVDHLDVVEADAHSATATVPDSLDAVLAAAMQSARDLDRQALELESGLGELNARHTERVDAQVRNEQMLSELLEQKDSLLKAEDDARSAAEAVIAAQNILISKARDQQNQISELLERERARLLEQQDQVERSRDMARKAAALARKAAIAQQEIRSIAKREYEARVKSEQSARRAVSIARNAISALAKEEKKRQQLSH